MSECNVENVEGREWVELGEWIDEMGGVLYSGIDGRMNMGRGMDDGLNG